MAAYPALLPHGQKANIRGVKVVDFHKHLRFVLFVHTATSIGLFKLEQKYVFLGRKEWLRYRFLNYGRRLEITSSLNKALDGISTHYHRYLLHNISVRCFERTDILSTIAVETYVQL